MDIFTFEDFIAGRCQLQQVGQPKQSAEQPDQPNPDQQPAAPKEFKPLTKAERRVKMQNIIDGILHVIEANPAGALDDNGSTINKLLDIASKLEMEDDAPQLADLTARKLEQMPTGELLRTLIAPVLALPAEHRDAVLAAWGIRQDNQGELFDMMA